MIARSDCEVVYSPGGTALAVQIDSTVGALYGRAIETAARSAAAECEVTVGRLTIRDDGALDVVVAARVEAALREAGFHRRAPASGRTASRRPPQRERRRRSRLYIPGNQPDFLPNSGLFGADCIILDLEDSVPPPSKEAARILVRRVIESHAAFFRDSEIIVRINPLSGPWGVADVVELSRCLPDAIILPKCDTSDRVRALDRQLGRLERLAGLPASTLILPLVETASGVLAAASVAAASLRVAGICFGAEDFAADIGARRTADGTEALLARQTIVLGARAAGVQALDSVFSDVDDTEGFLAYCAQSRAMGFDGVGVVHPRQVPIANQQFSPSVEEVEQARRIVAALEEAEARGMGVASLDGTMIDAPVAARARRVLANSAPRGP